MTTLYSPKTPISAGLVEIVNLYDHRFLSIFLDGKQMASVEKEGSFATEIIKRSFIKNCVKTCGVSEDKLEFVLIDFESYAEPLSNGDYDCNDYMDDYKAMQDFVALNGKIKKSDITYLAKGVEKLEKVVDRY